MLFIQFSKLVLDIASSFQKRAENLWAVLISCHLVSNHQVWRLFSFIAQCCSGADRQSAIPEDAGRKGRVGLYGSQPIKRFVISRGKWELNVGGICMPDLCPIAPGSRFHENQENSFAKCLPTAPFLSSETLWPCCLAGTLSPQSCHWQWRNSQRNCRLLSY